MSVIGLVHDSYVFDRRVRVLAGHLAEALPEGARVLDVGCGDGRVAKLIMERRSDVSISGIDVLIRGQTHIPVEPFDGRTIPHGDASFDAVTFVDVLHHTDDPMVMLREAARVARRVVVIKDHTRDGLLAGPTLRLMDWVGNARHGVVLPYNYWPRRRWLSAFGELGLGVESWASDVGLYPPPLSWAFGRSLHFVARLAPSR